MELKIDQPTVLGPDEIDTAWQLYESRFAPLRRAAMQRHCMTLPELHYVCKDPNVEKWRAFSDRDELVALATYTNNLPSMPLISPEYFEARWPTQFAARRIWYCGFVCVAEDAPMRTFLDLIGQMFRQGAGADGQGVIALDYCVANTQLSDAVARQLTKFAKSAGHTGLFADHTGFEAVARDQQSYWTYGPAPLAVTS